MTIRLDYRRMVNQSAVKSNINILGGFEDFYKIPDWLSSGSVSFNERTEASSKRYLSAVHQTFNQFQSDQVKQLFLAGVGAKGFSEEAKKRIMTLQFTAVDPLFQLLFTSCFVPIVQSGRTAITKNDVIAFLDDKIKTGTLTANWTRETIDTVSRKFLSVLKKLGFLNGKVKKGLADVYIGSDFLIFFHYWLQAFDETSNVLSSRFFPMLMVSKEKYIFLLKQEVIRAKIDWSYSGDKVQVSTLLTIDEYTNELSDRLR